MYVQIIFVIILSWSYSISMHYILINQKTLALISTLLIERVQNLKYIITSSSLIRYQLISIICLTVQIWQYIFKKKKKSQEIDFLINISVILILNNKHNILKSLDLLFIESLCILNHIDLIFFFFSKGVKRNSRNSIFDLASIVLNLKMKYKPFFQFFWTQIYNMIY